MNDKSRADFEDLFGSYPRAKPRRYSSRFTGSRSSRGCFLLLLCIILLYVYVLPRATTYLSSGAIETDEGIQETSKHVFDPISPVTSSHGNHSNSSSKLVPLEAHIMSKCPDAKDCLVDLIVPAMQLISDKVTFQLSYIGWMAADDTVQCKHGPTECLGNIMGLCAQDLFPTEPKRSLGFMNCMVRQFSDIPSRDLAEHCASEHGISFDDLNACVSEEGKGLELLEASIKRTAAANVVKSCTVRVNEEIWCIRDGGQWSNCPEGSTPRDLVKAVTDLHEKQ